MKKSFNISLVETQPVPCRKTLWLLGFPMDFVSYTHTMKPPRYELQEGQELSVLQHCRDSAGDPVCDPGTGEPLDSGNHISQRQ